MNTEPWLPQALAIVKRWEGCKLTAYLCPAGVWTIGYGATGAGIQRGTQWTQQEAESDLRKRLLAFGAKIDAAVKVRVTGNQFAALVSLAYNIGINAFLRSTLLRKLNAGDYAGAASEFMRWNRAGGRVLAGLTNRRIDERKVFES